VGDNDDEASYIQNACITNFSAYQQGVDMNLGDYDGRTALHLAAAEGHLRCVKFLLEECKVKHDPKDRWGQTPLTEAILFKHTKVASLIKRHERALGLSGKAKVKRREEKKRGLLISLAPKSHFNDPPPSFSLQEVAFGDALWRKLVEKNLMKPEKEKPVYKVSEITVLFRHAVHFPYFFSVR